MSTDTGPLALTPFEQDAFRRAIDTVRDPKARAALLRQFEAVRVTAKDYTGAGFIIDFACPPELRSSDIPDTGDGELPVLDLYHPNHRLSVHFLVRVQDGAIVLFDGMSMEGPWWEEEAAAGLWPDGGGPIVFDPALMKMPVLGPEELERRRRSREPALLPVERESVRRAVMAVKDDRRREVLLRQIESLRVRKRSYGDFGFYVDFDSCPPELCVVEPHGANVTDQGAIRLIHSDGGRHIDFDAFVLHGAIAGLRGAAGDRWSEEEIHACLWPGTREPISFDPAFIRPQAR